MIEVEQYVYKQRNRHKFHIVMTCLTCGIWGVTVWPAMIAWNYLRSGRKSWNEVSR